MLGSIAASFGSGLLQRKLMQPGQSPLGPTQPPGMADSLSNMFGSAIGSGMTSAISSSAAVAGDQVLGTSRRRGEMANEFQEAMYPGTNPWDRLGATGQNPEAQAAAQSADQAVARRTSDQQLEAARIQARSSIGAAFAGEGVGAALRMMDAVDGGDPAVPSDYFTKGEERLTLATNDARKAAAAADQAEAAKTTASANLKTALANLTNAQTNRLQYGLDAWLEPLKVELQRQGVVATTALQSAETQYKIIDATILALEADATPERIKLELRRTLSETWRNYGIAVGAIGGGAMLGAGAVLGRRGLISLLKWKRGRAEIRTNRTRVAGGPRPPSAPHPGTGRSSPRAPHRRYGNKSSMPAGGGHMPKSGLDTKLAKPSDVARTIKKYMGRGGFGRGFGARGGR